MVERWVCGNLTERPKAPFIAFGQAKLVNNEVITIMILYSNRL